jgi:hypothetical protein
MNERIKQLAEDAGFRPSPFGIYDRNQAFDIEGFAEDIIRECIEATGNCAGTGDMIKEHFGM